jgi:hypothetical protein
MSKIAGLSSEWTENKMSKLDYLKGSDKPVTQADLALHGEMMREYITDSMGAAIGTIIAFGILIVVSILFRPQIVNIFNGMGAG